MTEKTIHHAWELTEQFWVRIAEITNQHGYMSGVDRQSDRVKETGEVFTPTELVIKVIQKLPLHELQSGKTVLDPACGDGQFLLPAILVKLALRQVTDPEITSTEESILSAKLEALGEVYGVDIMVDNVKLTRQRILRVLGLVDSNEAEKIVNNNIIVGNTKDPHEPIEGQSEADKKRMLELFSDQGGLDLEDTFKRKMPK